MKKILLISPELEYTGALNMLLNFTKALKENNYAPKILSYEPGPFVREFDKLGVLVEIIDENDIVNNSIRAKFLIFLHSSLIFSIFSSVKVSLIIDAVLTLWILLTGLLII